ncbi:MAG: hypothetical protein HYZ57_18290 [Acidobacteria bacterium]|nr:hypothetical protein [Acidobacteriota bacterium]
MTGPEPPLDAEAVRQQMRRILASDTFAHSERLSRFLRFTVEQAVAGNAAKLKEYYVGVEVFDRTPSYDPRTDPIVRVEARRLRLKLDEYYDLAGARDPIRIRFPKGSYAPAFEINAGPRRRPAIPHDWRNVALVASLGFALIAGARWAALSRAAGAVNQRTPALDRAAAAFWRGFFAPGVRNIAVFGSPVFLASEGNRFFIRLPHVNDATTLLSSPDVLALQSRFGALEGPRYDYAQMGDAIALHRLTAFLAGHGAPLTGVPAHLATWEGLKDGNIVFLGAPRMNPLLNRLAGQQDFEWGADQVLYNRRAQPGEETRWETKSHRDSITYAVISSLPGLRPDRRILLLTSHMTAGSLAAIDFVTGAEGVRLLSEKVRPGKNPHFQLVLRVYVDRDNPVRAEYVTHHVVASPPK